LIDHIAEIGFDPQFGARPLKRAIQSELEDALARIMLAGERDFSQEVLVDYDGGIVIQ
jgi:ATP-dependent Clp protease ATP-binding subunit ClpA